MKNVIREVSIIGLVVMATAILVGAQGQSKIPQNWQLTEDETLWAVRYDNCEYGYFSLLPQGAIAHAEHPPDPHHGYLINPADLGSKHPISVYDSNRFVWVNANYTDALTLADISDFEIEVAKADKNNSKLIERHRATLRSVPATRFRLDYVSAGVSMVQEEIVALRSGVIYTLGLRTPVEHYAEDFGTLEQALSGFRFYRTPPKCSDQ
jgi:hypothetical protein